MTAVISDDTRQALHMTPEESKRELAVLLFQQGKCTLGQASQIAGVTHVPFQFLLASRQIPIHFDIAEFDADL